MTHLSLPAIKQKPDIIPRNSWHDLQTTLDLGVSERKLFLGTTFKSCFARPNDTPIPTRN